MNGATEEIRSFVFPRRRMLTLPPGRLTADTIDKKQARILSVLQEGRGKAPMSVKDVQGVVAARFQKNYAASKNFDFAGCVKEMVTMGYITEFGNGLAITQSGDALHNEVKCKRPELLQVSSSPNVPQRA